MKSRAILASTLLAASAGACAPAARTPAPGAPSGAASEFNVPVEYFKLDNGLRVVLARDTTAPTAIAAVYYNIGFRVEPRDRTGFAHLFEHMMFQGSRNLGKMQHVRMVQANGGVFNGSTTFDFTNYYQVVPSHALEPVLWAEADRMSSLSVTEENLRNQKEVVKSEIQLKVLNVPYGGFPWVQTAMAANTNWHNSHNFWGNLSDLDAATLEDVRSFFRTYYAPNNAALVVTGHFRPEQVKQWVAQYFGAIPRAPEPPRPDLAEPRQTQERRVVHKDPKAPRPALAVAYHTPPRGTPEYYAMGLIDQILAQDKDSEFYRTLVQERGLTGQVYSGINLLGNLFTISGPALWEVFLFHDSNVSADTIVQHMETAIARLRTQPVDPATLDRARVKMRADLYDNVEASYGFGRAHLLGSLALFDDDPDKINRLEAEFARVTPELLRRTAEEYLRPTSRTVVRVEPDATPAGEGK